MRSRHLEYARGTGVADLGPAALDELLDRGDLEAWKPLARAIASDPWGKTADTVLRLCDAHPMYGTSTLWRSWIEQRRGISKREAPGLSLADARARAGLTQQQMAQRLGISQADVSKLERRTDARLSTLHAYARALGTALRVSLQWPGTADTTPLELNGLNRTTRTRRTAAKAE
jgi:DNA-binding XRE family transcriptional regulator